MQPLVLPSSVKLYYQEEGIAIIHGDARDIWPSLPPVDALVTDPPFGIHWSRATWHDDPQDYPALIHWVVQEAKRSVLGWCFIFQAMPNVGHFHEWFPEGWRLFAACKNFAQIRPTAVWHSWDPVVFWNNGPNSGPNTRTINRDYHIGNVAGVMRWKPPHICPRPLDTMCHLVALAAAEGGVVIDPFMGSGTTLLACKEFGRLAIGIDSDESCCEMAVNRLRQGVLDLAIGT